MRASRKPTGDGITGVPVDKAGLTSWLVMKGEGLGFHTETGYTSPECDAVADVAWALNPNQKPIFTFNVEEADPTMILPGALQWAGSSTEPRSWIHVYMFLSGSSETLATLPFPSNIKLYDSQGITSLPGDLEELTANMARILSRYVGVSTGSTLRESVKGAAVATDGWPIGKPNTRLSYTASARLGEELVLFAAENGEDGEAKVPALKSSRNVVPLEIASGGASFGGALMRLIEAGAGHFLFSTEHRNYPFVMRLNVAEGGGPSRLDLWFDADKSNVPQALGFWALIEAVESSRSVSLLGPSGEVAGLSIHG